MGRNDQLAVRSVHPAVVIAAKLFGVAASLAHHHRPLVAATIVQNMNGGALAAANHHHGMLADSRRYVVAGIGNLGFMPHINPGHAEDSLHLQLENILADEQLAVVAGGLDHGRKFFNGIARHVFSPPRGDSEDLVCQRCHRH